MPTQFERDAMMDVVQRMSNGSFGYLVVVLLLGLTSNYAFDYPQYYWPAAALVLFSILLRQYLASHRERLALAKPQQFRRATEFAVASAAVPTAFLYGSALSLYGLESWPFIAMMTTRAGVATGGAISFTPAYRLLVLHVVILQLGSLVGSLLVLNGRSMIYLSLTIALSVYLLVQGRLLHEAYRRAWLDQQSEMQRRRELELAKKAAEDASQAKSQFLANMSHEIRTPMNGILGMAQALRDCNNPQQTQEYTDAILVSGRALLKLLNELLDFSKFEAGKQALELRPVRLAEELADLRLVFRMQAEAKGLRLHWQMDPGLHLPLLGDESRLRQVLLNLLGNALKFTEQGEIGLQVTQEAEDNESATFRFTVTDTGIGVPADKRELIFEAFAQANPGISRQFGGTGLGLAISNQLVRLMGGSLQLEANAPQGSRFWFTVTFPKHKAEERAGALLPEATGPIGATDGAATVDEASVDEASAGRQFATVNGVEPDEPPRGEALEILVAEDNVINQRVARALLEKQGHSVTVAANGRVMLDLCRVQHFDVILVDNQMPEMDGVDALVALRAWENEQRQPRTPAIMLTASAMPGEREAFLAKGFDGYLAKPYAVKELLALIESQPVRRRQGRSRAAAS